ncbi:MAG: Ig-like domain-containing protein [Haliscomenobacter sp.]|nr:Ig-like domain-containing protein [Haliscomenobacter sp.]
MPPLNRNTIPMQLIRIVFFQALCLAIASCATITPPEGGPKDTVPPLIDTARTTPSGQVNFAKQPIEIAFQEWIVLEDAANQVLVSPPLEFRPTTRLKRRTVIFEFQEKEQLRPNVTYTINFGTAVKDLTEKNPADNLRFVFATGPQLDSLTFQGVVKDALTGEPVEKALFMLYENPADSVVRKQRPLYFAKTDKEGRFQIKNIREGVFKGFALADVNSNYRFDLPNEKIGFPDSLIAIGPGATTTAQIRLFQETPTLRVQSTDTSAAGLIKIAFNQPPVFVRAVPDDTSQVVVRAVAKDTLLIWTPVGKPGTLILRQDTLSLDTIAWAGWLSGKAQLAAGGVVSPKPGPDPVRQHPEEDFLIRFRAPANRIDTAMARLFRDSLPDPATPNLYIDSTDARIVRLRQGWQEDAIYRLELQPGAIQDLFGRNLDSALVFLIKVDPRKSYGNIRLKLSGLDTIYPYLLELLLADGSIYLQQRLEAGGETRELEFRLLPPQAFTLRVVEDRNRNGVWDSGRYESKVQPERVTLYKLEALRANWDLEAEVKLEN